MASTTSTVVMADKPELRNTDGGIFEVPDFTMKEIYDAIPAHCFKASMTRSLLYVVRDFAYVAVLVYASSYIQYVPNAFARALLWTAYTVVQGMVFTGIWILAHECGHGAFSKSKTVNWNVGLVLHSFLLVPFHSWRITHSAHHKATGNLEKDMAFVPYTKETYEKANANTNSPVPVKHEHDHEGVTLSHLAEDAPIVVLWNCIVHQLFGWPGYLFFNISGQKYPESFPKQSHFYAGSDNPLWRPRELPLIVLSDIGVLVMIGLLAIAGHMFGSLKMIVLYAIPYLWVNHWLVAITFLHHTDGRLPHYSNKEWTFAKGAAATIDRDFGFIDTHLFHDIIGTHVTHHLVSTIPFYHAKEASVAVRKVMGKHYVEDRETNFLVSFWNAQRDFKYVEESVDGSGVYFYNKKESVPSAAEQKSR